MYATEVLKSSLSSVQSEQFKLGGDSAHVLHISSPLTENEKIGQPSLSSL